MASAALGQNRGFQAFASNLGGDGQHDDDDYEYDREEYEERPRKHRKGPGEKPPEKDWTTYVQPVYKSNNRSSINTDDHPLARLPPRFDRGDDGSFYGDGAQFGDQFGGDSRPGKYLSCDLSSSSNTDLPR